MTIRNFMGHLSRSAQNGLPGNVRAGKRLNLSIVVIVSLLMLVFGVISSLRERSSLDGKMMANTSAMGARLVKAAFRSREPGPAFPGDFQGDGASDRDRPGSAQPG